MPDVSEVKLVEAFNLMWGNYPGPASLVHKSRKIIAVNDACRKGGREPGMNCSKWGTPELHKGCLANRTLKEQIPLYKESCSENSMKRIYWLPINGYPEYYVHFTTEPISVNE